MVLLGAIVTVIAECTALEECVCWCRGLSLSHDYCTDCHSISCSRCDACHSKNGLPENSPPWTILGSSIFIVLDPSIYQEVQLGLCDLSIEQLAPLCHTSNPASGLP